MDKPTFTYFEVVKTWAAKWYDRLQITKDIAEWICSSKPKPGVAFGNVKTHKTNNPVRLITSCCGTAIEKLSEFTEFYLKPLAQNLPSFVKDTTQLLNKIHECNVQGPLPKGTLLVSWDVVSMFPNIDNKLGLSAVEDALETRDSKFPSTECILEAVEICLKHNNCQFYNNNFLQIHGTAMGPKNACSYADLAMGEIDKKAKSHATIRPNLWWRYRDDIIDFWTLGLDKLFEFTEYINSLYPTIKFELVYSESELHVLDLTLRLEGGFITTDVYSKPTDSHLYLPYSSAHPQHCKKAIPFGVALRLKRNCSNGEVLDERCEEYKQYLTRQNYPREIVDRGFEKALQIERANILRSGERKQKKKIYPLVVKFNPRLPDISKIIKGNVHLLHSPALEGLFANNSVIPAFRRGKNLKEIVAPSKFKKNQIDRPNPLGCVKCTRRCDLCQNFMIESDSFKCLATGKRYKIKQTLNCTSNNVVYLITCEKCNLQYVGSTSTQFKVRFRNHKSSMITKKQTCEMAIHFNSSLHNLADIKFIVIEKVNCENEEDLDSKLLSREAYWTAQLFTLNPHGINKRNELNSRKRINYTQQQ